MCLLCCFPSCCYSEVGPNSATWIYFSGFSLTAIITWVLRDYSTLIFKHIGFLNSCLSSQDSGVHVDATGSCVGKGAVVRISLGNFIFFGAHAVLLLGVTRQRQGRRLLHTAGWSLQLLLWFACILGCFFMPNSVFGVYGQVAKVAAGIFLVLIILIIADWVYLANEWLLELDNCAAQVVLVAGAVTCYAAGAIAIGFLYHSYAPRLACSLNIGWISGTLLLAAAYTAVSVSPWRSPSAGLLTSGVVFLYSTYLLWAALSSEPVNSCSGNPSTKGLQVAGFFVAIAAALAATMDAGMQGQTFWLGAAPREGERLGEPRGDEQLLYRPDWFHTVFMLASAYLAMVLTGWELQDGPSPWTLDKDWFSSWIKMSSQWLCALLYFWSLLAATLLKRWRHF